MDKQQYKHVMEQIQMSDTCAQKILDIVQQEGKSKPLVKKRVTWEKRSLIAAAVAACISVVSIFSVTAAQHTEILHLLFPEKETVNETAVQTNMGIENFSYTGFEDVKLTPVGAVADAKQLHVFIHLSSGSTEVNEDYIKPYISFQDVLINGEPGFLEERTNGVPQLVQVGQRAYKTETADGYTIDFSYEFETALTESTLHIETPLRCIEQMEFMEEELTSTTEVGTLSYDVNVEQRPSRTLELDVPLVSNRFSAKVVRVDIHALGMEIFYCGSFQGWLNETLAEAGASTYQDFKLVMQDGTAVSMWSSGGSWCMEDEYNHFTYMFDEPIDPEKAAYIACGNIQIPLTQ